MAFMMDVVGIRYAKDRWAQLMAEVEASGRELVLSRRGRPVAMIVKLPAADATPESATPSGEGDA